MQRRFWGGDPVPVGIPSLNVLRLPSKRLRNRHLAWGDFASKSSFERTIAETTESERDCMRLWTEGGAKHPPGTLPARPLSQLTRQHPDAPHPAPTPHSPAPLASGPW